LIYLESEAQKKALSLFQYALKPGGFLLLGSSENIGDFTNFFTPVDRKWRLFRRTGLRAVTPMDTDFSNMSLPPTLLTAYPREVAKGRSPGDLRQLVEKLLLDHYDPVGILINEAGEILYSHGPVDLYLKVAPGEARFNLVDMARSGLQAELMTAIRPAMSQTETVRLSGIEVKINGGQQRVDISIKPALTSEQSNLFLIILEKATARPASPAASSEESALPEGGDPRLQSLREELALARRQLQNMIEELQAANEEHRSYAEELQSANEELQSTNEELTTSQEELQSVNEELVTANTEIQSKNTELRQANDDLHNLLTGTNIATLFLDTRLNIKRFTPAATQIVNLIATDVGRPLQHTVSNLAYDHLIEDAERVLDTLNTLEREVETRDGRWYAMRILPYRTLNNVIEGVVLTFAEITSQKEVEVKLRQVNEELRVTQDYSRLIIDTLHEGLLILEPDLRIRSANRSFYQKFEVTETEIEGKRLYDLGNGQWDIPELRRLLEEIIPQNSIFEGFEVEHNFPRIGPRQMRLNARRLTQAEGQGDQILLAIEDISNHGP
jgi:two-component system CheB/CheR fusion protein